MDRTELRKGAIVLVRKAVVGALLAAAAIAAGATAPTAGASEPGSPAPVTTGPSRPSSQPSAEQARSGSPAGTYVPVRQFRAVDTTTGAGGNRKGSVKHRHGFAARVTGRHGVPRNVAAVAVTVTAESPDASGGFVLYRAGTHRPKTDSVLYTAGHSASATTIVRTTKHGKIAVYNSARHGRADVSLDVTGYYMAGHPSDEQPGVLHTVGPERAFGRHSIGAHRSVTADLGGRAGVPASSVGAVAVAVTVHNPAKSGGLSAFQAGAHRPQAALVSFDRGVDTVGYGLVPTDGDGRIALYNASHGKVHVSVAVLGYTVGGVVTRSGATQVGAARRVLPHTKLRAHHGKKLRVTGHAGVPKGHVTAVLLDLTATGKKAGSLTAWPLGSSRPDLPSLRFPAHATRSAMVLVRPSKQGRVKIRNDSSRSAHVAVDVLGYVAAVNIRPAGPPEPSASHYVRRVHDAQDLYNIGCDDATNGSTFVLLDLGAQSVTPPLSTAHPGVLLSATQTRLTYAQLRAALLGTGTGTTGYLPGFANCAHGTKATVAVGTNNDGSYSGAHAYPAAQRGRDWARFIASLGAAAPGRITVVGANDIESDSFTGNEAQAESWTKAYLAVDNTGSRVGKLVYNGSADGCPTTLGVVGRKCHYGWTQADYYALTHGLGPSRLLALPQVYNAAQPRQWANIDAQGGGRIEFAGSLTEYGSCPRGSAPGCGGLVSATPRGGWHALYDALATVVAHPELPAATDLDIDGDPVG